MNPFIYGLVDPREPEHIRYVGLAMLKNRPYQHVKAARKGVIKSYCYNWVRLLLAEGREPIIRILEKCRADITRKELGEYEKHHIQQLRVAGHRLTNMTDGGEGGGAHRGKKHSEEAKAKMSAAKRGRSSHMLGKHHSDETKEKIRAVFKGRKLTPEHVQNIREGLIGKMHIPSMEERARMSLAYKGQPGPSAEMRLQISEKQKNNWKNKTPEQRVEHGAATSRGMKLREAALAVHGPPHHAHKTG